MYISKNKTNLLKKLYKYFVLKFSSLFKSIYILKILQNRFY